MRDYERIEDAGEIIRTRLLCEGRVAKCVAIGIIQKRCGISRSVAKGYLLRMIKSGFFEDLWYDICLPRDKRGEMPKYKSEVESV